jgi:CubicO group peptidase (beta-lactamase class C family)
LVVLSFFPGGLAGQDQDRTTHTQLEGIDSYVAARLERGRIPGAALAIVQGDSILHMRSFGIADPSGRLVDVDTPFILGSTSKSLTATAAMQLVDAGRLALDSPVTRYLPWFRAVDAEASAKITVRDLLIQTSGLPEATGRARLADGDTSSTALERHARAVRDVALIHAPGSRFEYSNTNYSVMGLIVQAVSGQSYESFIQENVFEPLQMRGSFTSQDVAMRAGMATGYRYWFGRPKAAPTMPFVRWAVPAGYLISNARDLAHYLIAHLNDGAYAGRNVVSPKGMRELHRPVADMSSNLSYAMGWVAETVNGEIVLWHNGGTPNFYSFMALLPERRLGVVFLANAVDLFVANQFDAIPRGLIASLRGEEPEIAIDAPFHPTLNIALIGVLPLFLLQLCWIGFSAVVRRPWARAELPAPVAWAKEAGRIGLPLLLSAAWVFGVLVYLPASQGGTLPVLLLYVPDAGSVLLASAVVAIVWGCTQAALRFYALQRELAGSSRLRIATRQTGSC